MRKTKIIVIFILPLILIVSTELVLRCFMGLGTPPLYIESERFEYIYAPNQKVNRFGNSIIVNEFSMRSKPLNTESELTILKIGDSVINGGALTDHDSLASSILENQLSVFFGKDIRVLNISGGSWGPDNGYAYINEFGNFNAKLIILVFSSHDYRDKMTFEKVVGHSNSYPNERPVFAVSELINRYVYPKIQKAFDVKDVKYSEIVVKQAKNGEVNPGWGQFVQYCKDHDIDLLVYLHPEQAELQQKSYHNEGYKISEYLKRENIHVIEGLNYPFDSSHYRDNIHLNNKGQKMLAEVLLPYLYSFVLNGKGEV